MSALVQAPHGAVGVVVVRARPPPVDLTLPVSEPAHLAALEQQVVDAQAERDAAYRAGMERVVRELLAEGRTVSRAGR